jgi:hypothetical protein
VAIGTKWMDIIMLSLNKKT